METSVEGEGEPPHDDDGVMEEGWGWGVGGEEVTRRRMKTNKGSRGRMTTCGPVAFSPALTHTHTDHLLLPFDVTASHSSVREGSDQVFCSSLTLARS